MRLTYLIGEPGVGKTTLVATLTADAHTEPCDLAGVPALDHRWPDGRALAELGRRRPGGFSGTDALGMAIQPKAVRALELVAPADVIAEGDRLGNLKFLTAARALGYDVTLAVATAHPDTIAARRRARGSNQDETWLAGRRTKVHNLAVAWNGPTIPLSLDRADDALATLRRHLWP